VAVKKGATLAPLAPKLSTAYWNEPFSAPRRCSSERPGAVKSAPLLGAAKQTLDGEDRSGTMGAERKARRNIVGYAAGGIVATMPLPGLCRRLARAGPFMGI